MNSNNIRDSVRSGVTVIVCTFNRSGSLATTLESLAVSRLPETAAWEVLVVDNNSTDSTRETVEGFCRRFPGRFRYIFEPRPGKSYALNTGIASAKGDILAFSDDDVIVEPTWLHNLTAELSGSEWAGAVGRVLPPRTFTPPSWLQWNDCVLEDRAGGFSFDVLAILFAHFDLGDEPGVLPANRYPCGANMAFRKTMFERYGGFRLDLGPRPNSQIRSEDTEFGRRLHQAGERVRYEPTATVYHPVPQERLRKQYVLSYWFDYGRASIRERRDRPSVYGIPWDYLSLCRRLVEIVATSVRWSVAVRPHKRFFYKCIVRMHAGMVAELYDRLLAGEPKEAPAL